MLGHSIYEAVTAYATVATAIPAIVVAYFGWLQSRQSVAIETTETLRKKLYEPCRLELAVTLRNRRRSAVLPWGVEAVGLPVLSVEVSDQKKGPNWTKSSASFPEGTIDPGQAKAFLVLIVPDWKAAARRPGNRGLKWSLRVRYEDCGRGRTYYRKRTMKFSADQIARYSNNETA